MPTTNHLQYRFESDITENDDNGNSQKAIVKKAREKMMSKIEKLSESYLNLRKRITLLVVTVLSLTITITFIGLILGYNKQPFEALVIAKLSCGSLLVICNIVAIVVISITYLFNKTIKFLSIVLWGAMWIWILIGSFDSPFTVTAVVSTLVVLTYVVFPVPMLWAVIGGSIALIAHGCRHIGDLDDHGKHFDHYIFIITEMACLTAVNILGAYIKFTTDLFHTQAFTHTYEDLKARIELEKERERQEQLLLSIIPADLAFQMRQSMVERLSEESGQANSMSAKRLWHDFYVREHKQVSILFADLVNFTELTTKCSAKDLVSMLNEIYGKFDAISRANDCTRIKTLGDCYCCVSGMPVSRPHHAENVVKTGLQMVQTIKSIRDSTTSILDMRIGVHSGNVLCGVLGTVKWKYDIWSEDVAYANFLESAGIPGKIHISKETMIQLAGSYTVSGVNPPVVNSAGEPQQTFLIKEINIDNHVERKTSFQRTRSFSSTSSTQQLSTFLQSWGAPKPFEMLANDRVIDDTTPKRSYDMLEASANSAFAPHPFGIDCNPKTYCSLANCRLSTFTKRSNTVVQSSLKKLQSESAFSVSIAMSIYFIFTAIVHCIIFSDQYAIYIISGCGLPFFGFVSYFYLERKRNENKKPSQIKHSHIPYYTLLAFTVIIHMSFTIVTHHIGLPLESFPINTSTKQIIDSVSHSADMLMLSRCADLLVLLPIFAFTYANTMVKIVINLLILIILVVIMVAREVVYFVPYRGLIWEENHEKVIPALYAAAVCYTLASVILLLYSKQMESSREALIMWKMQFHVENVEVETMKTLTKLLLMNILPQHVATYYLERPIEGELYHESYDNACIMFATVVHFDEFFKMSSDYDREHQCLRLLNEIIGDFDTLLSKPKYSVIEKMKTVGSTYMAAAGLQPGRDINGISNGTLSLSRRTPQQFVQVMADFALAMFSVLDTINKHSFNNFKMRIGLSHGPVIAGVVGAQRPQYDVWGDTVNMASRMDSGGLIGKIQMTESTGELLMAVGYPVVCRGKTVVKGKHDLVTTYLLEPLSNKPTTPLTREQSSTSETNC